MTCHVSPCQGIPWVKVDYFDNGIICNLIEHVSSSLIPGTSCSRLLEHPSPVSLSPLPPYLIRMVRRAKDEGAEGRQ